MSLETALSSWLRERKGQNQSTFCDKGTILFVRVHGAVSSLLFEYQFCKGFGTGTTARIHESEPNLTSPRRGNAPFARSADAGPLLRGQKGALVAS